MLLRYWERSVWFNDFLYLDRDEKSTFLESEFQTLITLSAKKILDKVVLHFYDAYYH